MEKRGQFTFYRSYFEAIMEIPEEERLGVLAAIIAYGLDGTEPEGLSPIQKAVFILVRPTLDAGRKKAIGGKRGGDKTQASRKLAASMAQASCKHAASKKEEEKEKENEIEIENECYGAASAAFEEFWNLYPVKLEKQDARKAWDEGISQKDVGFVMDGLARWRQSGQWTSDGGRFVPRAAKWLRGRHFENPPEAAAPCGALGQLGQAELEAIELVMKEELR